MKLKNQDLYTPANLVTSAGLVFTVYGSFRLNTPIGFWLVLIGRIADSLDGFIARRSHVSSFGAKLDATFDKISGLFILTSAYYFRLVPVLFLLFLLIQHLGITLIALTASSKKIELKVSDAGKIGMFIQIATILTYVASNLTGGLLSGLLWLSTMPLTAASIILGTVALVGYMRNFVSIKRKTP